MRGKAAVVALVSAVFTVGIPAHGSADRPYNSAVELEAIGGSVIAKRAHDYAKRNHAVTFEGFRSSTDQFDSANLYSRILIERVGGQKIFEGPSPPLNHLWVAPTGDYVVGLSQIRHSNPYQVVVFSKTGRVLVARGVDCHRDRIVGCTETVSKYVFWYDKQSPVVSIFANGDRMVLIVDTTDWVNPLVIPFTNPQTAGGR